MIKADYVEEIDKEVFITEVQRVCAQVKTEFSITGEARTDVPNSSNRSSPVPSQNGGGVQENLDGSKITDENVSDVGSNMGSPRTDAGSDLTADQQLERAEVEGQKVEVTGDDNGILDAIAPLPNKHMPDIAVRDLQRSTSESSMSSVTSGNGGQLHQSQSHQNKVAQMQDQPSTQKERNGNDGTFSSSQNQNTFSRILSTGNAPASGLNDSIQTNSEMNAKKENKAKILDTEDLDKQLSAIMAHSENSKHSNPFSPTKTAPTKPIVSDGNGIPSQGNQTAVKMVPVSLPTGESIMVSLDSLQSAIIDNEARERAQINKPSTQEQNKIAQTPVDDGSVVVANRFTVSKVEDVIDGPIMTTSDANNTRKDSAQSAQTASDNQTEGDAPITSSSSDNQSYFDTMSSDKSSINSNTSLATFVKHNGYVRSDSNPGATRPAFFPEPVPPNTKQEQVKSPVRTIGRFQVIPHNSDELVRNSADHERHSTPTKSTAKHNVAPSQQHAVENIEQSEHMQGNFSVFNNEEQRLRRDLSNEGLPSDNHLAKHQDIFQQQQYFVSLPNNAAMPTSQHSMSYPKPILHYNAQFTPNFYSSTDGAR